MSMSGWNSWRYVPVLTSSAQKHAVLVKPHSTERMLSKLTDNCWLQVHENGSWNVFPGSCLQEERLERVVALEGGVVRHEAIRLDSVLETVQLPACVAYLAPGLADMHRNALPLKAQQVLNHKVKSDTTNLIFMFTMTVRSRDPR